MEHAKKMFLVPATSYNNGKEEDEPPRDKGMTGGGGSGGGGGIGGDTGHSVSRTFGNGDAAETPSDKRSVQTPGNPISRLDNELFKLLYSKKFKNAADRWVLYHQMLQRYLFLVESGKIPPPLPTEAKPPQQTPTEETNGEEEEESPPPTPTPPSPLRILSTSEIAIDEFNIVKTLPRSYKKRAAKLIKYLIENTEAAKRISWNKEGGVTIDSVFIPGSDIADLINDAARPRKTFVPQGREQFIKCLRGTGIPQSLIGNKVLWYLGRTHGNKRRREINSKSDITKQHIAKYRRDTSSALSGKNKWLKI